MSTIYPISTKRYKTSRKYEFQVEEYCVMVCTGVSPKGNIYSEPKDKENELSNYNAMSLEISRRELSQSGNLTVTQNSANVSSSAFHEPLLSSLYPYWNEAKQTAYLVPAPLVFSLLSKAQQISISSGCYCRKCHDYLEYEAPESDGKALCWGCKNGYNP